MYVDPTLFLIIIIVVSYWRREASHHHRKQFCRIYRVYICGSIIIIISTINIIFTVIVGRLHTKAVRYVRKNPRLKTSSRTAAYWVRTGLYKSSSSKPCPLYDWFRCGIYIYGRTELKKTELSRKIVNGNTAKSI